MSDNPRNSPERQALCDRLDADAGPGNVVLTATRRPLKFRCYASRCAVRVAWLAGLAMIAVTVGADSAFAQSARPASFPSRAQRDVAPPPVAAPADVEISLLADGELSDDTWSFISPQRDATLADTWHIGQSDGEMALICRGEPYGYLKTKRVFENFQLKLEWKFPFDEHGNSGILLYTNGQEKDKVWPTAMQVQLHQPVCGSIFPSGNAKSDNEIRDVRDFGRPVNQWNSCEITSAGGRISVVINGKKVGVVSGCRPDKGGIALQSEGSEVHFRRIRLTEFAEGNLPSIPVSQVPASNLPCMDECGTIGSFHADAGFDPWISARSLRRYRRLDEKALQYVVYRDPLAADDYPLRARDHERFMVAPAWPASGTDRHAHFRGWDRRHLLRRATDRHRPRTD